MKRRRAMKPSPKKSMRPRPQFKGFRDSHQTLKLDRFSTTISERASTTMLNKELFSYFIQKIAIQDSDPSKTLKSFREYILPTAAQLKYSDPSVVHYMEVLDDNPDSQETMAEVCELLMEKLLPESSQKWVLLVGDGKTYEHLRAVKRLYGPAF